MTEKELMTLLCELCLAVRLHAAPGKEPGLEEAAHDVQLCEAMMAEMARRSADTIKKMANEVMLDAAVQHPTAKA